MKTSDFDYTLPPELIAQHPLEPRDNSRLMVLERAAGSITHRKFFEIVDYLRPGDLMVFNDSRVIPARLRGKKSAGGGKLEILLLRRREIDVWEALVRPARRLRAGVSMAIAGACNGDVIEAEIIGEGEGGIRIIKFADESRLMSAGEVPLPPYIHTPLADSERYQTVYARAIGSVAAPTAGLHFTAALLQKIEEKGAGLVFVTLHIGLDTFRPVTEDDPRRHTIYREFGLLDSAAAGELNRAKLEGRRVICVGTTSARLVEHAVLAGGAAGIKPFEGWVDLFILPGHCFRAVDAMVTNFHLPQSTLLMLVTAFAGKELVDMAYAEAIAHRYRFYSFGDAMLIL